MHFAPRNKSSPYSIELPHFLQGVSDTSMPTLMWRVSGGLGGAGGFIPIGLGLLPYAMVSSIGPHPHNLRSMPRGGAVGGGCGNEKRPDTVKCQASVYGASEFIQ
jgi:hypothetical protein